MTDLHSIQQYFQNYVMDDKNPLPDIFVSTKQVSADVRLNIYVNAYRYRLVDALKSTYPVLTLFLGEDAFTELALNYIQASPSIFRSIRWFGDGLPDFIADYPEYKAYPYLVELAQLEWILCEVFDGPDSGIISIEDLASLAPEAWPQMQLHIQPTAKRVDFDWNVIAIWQAIIDEKEVPEAELNCGAWVFWRKVLTTRFAALTQREAWVFDQLLNGITWQDLCMGLCEYVDENEVPLYIAGLLKRWVVEGLICKIS